MRNIKKILMVALLLCLSLTVTLGLSSCGEAPHIHEFEKEVTLEATCTEEGELTFTCECGYSYTEEIKAKGHTVQIDSEVPATCTEGGLTEGSHCFDCGLVFEVQMETKPLGHKPGADATCTNAQVCENGCGMVFVEAYDHVTLTEPTCTEDAICIVCNSVAKPALGHSEVVVLGYEAGCFTTGVTDGINCDRCHSVVVAQEVIPATGHIYVPTVTEPTCKAGGYTTYTCKCGLEYVDDYTDIVNHDYVGEVTAPGCFDKGYTTYTCRFCSEASYVADYTDPTHIWEYYENNEGFERHCTNGCDAVENVATPVADSYKATINNSYVSDRINSLLLNCGKYGSWGVILNGAARSAEYENGIGAFDEANRSVTYEFYLDKAGYVDIIWTIAGSNWSSETGSNIGIADMAAHMTITIDGKPVDINGLELPDGGQWWNLQNFVIDGVALEAGVHTFECKVNVHGGLNVGYMTIQSNRDVNARSVNVLSADIVEENGKIYYDLKAELFGYTVDQLQMLDGALEYKLDSYVEKDGYTYLRYDVTQEYKLYPHLKADGRWYVNGINNAGDMTGVSLEEGKTVVANGRTYTISTIYSMPVLTVAMNEGTEASATIISADLVEENGKVYWLFTYKLVGYYPEYLRVVDGSTVFNWESYTENADGTVTYKINVTDAEIKIHYPHLKVMDVTYTGAGHNDAGDIQAPTFPTKSIVIGAKEYKMYDAWSMPVVEIVNNEPTMRLTAYDLVEENGKAILKLTFICYAFDESTAAFFGNDKAPLSYTYVRDGANVIYSIDITDKNASANIYMHMSIEGQNWNPKDNVASSNGDLLVHDLAESQSGSSWITKKSLTVNGRNYVLGNQYNMIVIGR